MYIVNTASTNNISTANAEFYSVCSRGDIFAHGASIAYHNGRFFASFAVNEDRENSIAEKTACWISDDGKNWRFFSLIGDTHSGLGRSHGILFSSDGKLYAYNASFTASVQSGVPNTYVFFPGLKTEGFVFNDEEERWDYIGEIADNFWPMNPPAYIGNNEYFIPGLNNCFFSAYLIGSVKKGWRRADTPIDGVFYSESACLADDKTIQLFMRNSKRNLGNDNRFLATAVSKDRGEHWEIRETEIYDNDSKPASIKLSNGFCCIVGNHLPNQGSSRESLDIIVINPQDNTSQLKIIRGTNAPAELAKIYAPQTTQLAISYPFCMEHENKLYVIYSASDEIYGNHNRIELAVIDIDELCGSKK